MKKVLMLTSALALAGCGTGLGGSLGNLLGSNPAVGGNANVQQACVAAQPVLTAGSMSSNQTVKSITSYGTAFCGPVLAGTPPSTTNSNSTNWVLGLITQLAPLVLAGA
jgi:poly-beta-hydroxyalkanoate depolymerase